tara:strand:+ start:504 stop:947 length:444 start_codon:yes stop_codon:yes gene_type:complete
MPISGGSTEANNGWFGNLTQIKLIGSDFMVDNDGITEGGPAVNEYGSAGAIQVGDAGQELYAYKSIPVGYMATGCRVNCNVSLDVRVYECGLVGNSGVKKDDGASATNTDINFTNVNSTTGNYLLIEIMTQATTDKIYGGTISIQRI